MKMRLNKMSSGSKWLMLIMMLAMISLTVFGVTNIFAEPDIKDMITEEQLGNFGTYEPNGLYDEELDGENLEFVAWLRSTDIFVSYDCWNDFNGDGNIDIEYDVYDREDYYKNVQMVENVYPVFDSGEYNDYYVVFFNELDKYNTALVDIAVSRDNDEASMQSKTNYWYDDEAKMLYLKKDLLEKSIENEDLLAFRSQTISLAKQTSEMTKKINVYTVFDEQLKNHENLDVLYKNTPNQEMEIKLTDWEDIGLSFKFVDPEYLAYVRAKNLTIYLGNNEMANEDWCYDEATGMIYINCVYSKVTDVIIKINDIETPKVEQQALLSIQDKYNETATAAAISSFESWINTKSGKKNSLFLDKLVYDTALPKVGKTENLKGTVTIHVNSSGYDHYYNFQGTWPTDNMGSIMRDYFANAGSKVNGEFQAATVSIKGGGENKKGYTFGDIIGNLYLASTKSDSQKYIDNIKSEIGAKNHNIGTNDTDYDSYYTSHWFMANKDCLYVTGTWGSSKFLGGVKTNNEGSSSALGKNAYFELGCGDIRKPSNDDFSGGTWPDGLSVNNKCDFIGKATIVEVNMNSANTGGNIVVAVWSNSVAKHSGGDHSQRLLGFSKIPFEYNGVGSGKFKKVDSTDTSQKGIQGAVYELYEKKTNNADNDCTGTPIATFTTTNQTRTVNNLAVGTYWVKEKTAAEGYLLRKTNIETIEIKAGQTTEKILEDDPQECHFELTVYDKTTKGRTEMPVPGIKFILTGPDGRHITNTLDGKNGEYTTDANGKISGKFRAVGICTLVQENTVKDYARQMQSREPDHCKIKIDATPTTSGKNILYTGNKSFKHYENRQVIDVAIHVQDENLKANSPSTLGGAKKAISYVGEGHANTLTTLVGCEYNVYATTNLFLGYTDSGQKVTITASESNPAKLTVKTRNTLGDAVVTDHLISRQEGATESSRAVLDFEGIVKDGVTYPVPNGIYKFKMNKASDGYLLENEDYKAVMDASWKGQSPEWDTIVVNRTSEKVEQKRQTIKIDFFVKGYDEEIDKITDENELIQATQIVNNWYSRGMAFSERNSFDTILDKSMTKNIWTPGSKITKLSQDTVAAYKDGQFLVGAKASQTPVGAIYVLENVTTIVDIKTGQEIPAKTVLGYYGVDATGYFEIDSLGTPAVKNINTESLASISATPACYPQTSSRRPAVGALPNGLYMFTPYVPADEFEGEYGLEEGVTDGLGWTEGKSTTETLNDQVLVMLKHVRIRDEVYDIPVAPDVPVPDPSDPSKPYDPYEPTNPDDPSGADPESNDIPLVDTKWVDDNTKNIHYRVTDSMNVTDNGSSLEYHMSDNLPVTFAFYLKDDSVYDPNYTYRYNLAFYYEVTENEYVDAGNANSNAEDSGEIMIHKGLHFRRFKAEGLSGGKSLSEAMEFNQKSDGYGSLTRLRDNGKNLTVSAAIKDTDWINDRLRTDKDGDVKILVQIKVQQIYKDKATNTSITVNESQPRYGMLTIKERELWSLD